jgi:hypothetical protein
MPDTMQFRIFFMMLSVLLYGCETWSLRTQTDGVRYEVFTAVRMVMFVSIFRAAGADSMFLRVDGIYRRVYTAPKPRRTSSLSSD